MKTQSSTSYTESTINHNTQFTTSAKALGRNETRDSFSGPFKISFRLSITNEINYKLKDFV